MISEVVMPQMGADMTQGTLLRWLKSEGDAVERGEVIAEIETDKANVEIEAFESGVFRKVIANEGDTVNVGEVIAVIAGVDEDISQYANGAVAKESRPAQGSEAPMAAVPAPPKTGVAPAMQTSEAPRSAAAPTASAGRVRASPLAKKMAAARGVELGTLRGSGPDGRILKRDVEGAMAGTTGAVSPSQSSAPLAATSLAGMSKMRQAIARRMAQSKREAPHYYMLVDVDMTEAMSTRAQINESVPEGGRVSINDLIVRACALALQRHPAFNTTIAGDAITQHDQQHICIAIALDDGLIAPAIVDAGTESLIEIGRASKDLIERAKNGALRADEISSGTFTITNLGTYGIEALIGIIQPPQTAILGVGSVMAQPAVLDGAVVVRQLMKVALSADHRITDGAQGAAFLGEIKTLLERPAALLL